MRALAEQSRDWVERNGINDPKHTKNVLVKIEQLYTADEIGERDRFTSQMPSKATYLKALNRGLIEPFARRSASSVRILFFNYILLGALDAHENHITDANFWRDAAVRTLGGLGAQHPITLMLEEYIRLRDLSDAATPPPTPPRIQGGAQALARVEDILPPPFEWVEIPAGKVTIEEGGYLEGGNNFDVPAFAIAKYPMTNGQFAKFIEAGGYRERKWWTEAGWQQKGKEGWTEPRYWQDKKCNGVEYPVVGVLMVEAVGVLCMADRCGGITQPCAHTDYPADGAAMAAGGTGRRWAGISLGQQL